MKKKITPYSAKKVEVKVKKKTVPKTEDEVKAILIAALQATDGYNANLPSERKKSLEYYRGDPNGFEQPNRSRVVSRDVLDTIETALPELLEIFVAGDEIARCEPTGEGDEAEAEQQTAYCNYVFNKQNEGFMILYTLIKDALLQKNGVAKVCWEEGERNKTKEEYEGLDQTAVNNIIADPDVVVEEQRIYMVAVNPMTGEEGEREINGKDIFNLKPTEIIDLRYDIKICRYGNYNGSNKIYNIPPEDFFVSPRAVNLDRPIYCGDKSYPTASELIKEYPDKRDLIDTLGGWDYNDYTSEKFTRFKNETGGLYNNSVDLGDRSVREVTKIEWFIYMDYDNDGVAELRRIVTASDGESGFIILENEEYIVDNPYISITPYPMPHKFYGMSLADLIMDIQLIKTTILRQLLDNIYQTNNRRLVVNSRLVDMDTVLDSKPNGIILAESIDQIRYLENPVISSDSMGILDKMDQVREVRTGVFRGSRGLDVDRLHDTAQGISKLLDKLDKRIMLIARVFAETGIKNLFRKILKNAVLFQDKETMLEIGGRWTTINTQSWNIERNISIHVGLGTGNKEETIARIMQLMSVQQQAYAANSSSVTPENMWNSLKDLVKSLGKKTPEMYFTPPEKQTPQQSKEDPVVTIEKMRLEQKAQEVAAQIEFNKWKAEQDNQTKIAIAAEQSELKKMEIGADMMTNRKTENARPGGSLAE